MSQVLVLSEFDANSWTSRWQQGHVPSALPYGMEHLHHEGWSLHVPRTPTPRTTAARRAISASSNRLGFPWVQSVRHARTAADADVVMGVLEPHVFAAAQLRRAKVPGYMSKPLVALTCWAGQTLRDGTSAERTRIRRLMGDLDRIYVLSENQIEIFLSNGFREDQLCAVPYGVDTDFYTPGQPQDRVIDVLAVGLDRGRDYGTFFAAVRDLPLNVTVVAKKKNIAHLDVPSNVRFLGTVDHRTYRSLVRRAAIVAVPTHDYAYPTGQSVALESSATGTPVMVTSTAAMRQYFTDGVDAVMPRVHDPEHWRETLMDLHRDDDLRARLSRNALNRVIRKFSTRNLWEKVNTDLTELVDRSG